MAASGKNRSSALILAGGRSSRFGSNKALLPYRGTSLMGHIISRLEPHFSEIIISANNPPEYIGFGLPVCTDIFTDAGPLGGIHAGLAGAKSDWVFITACDMPYVSIPVINQMKHYMTRDSGPGFGVIAMTLNGFIEPFHAFYSKSIIPDLETAASAGIGISRFIGSIPHRTIKCSDERVFFNINRPEDFSVLLACNA